MVESFRDWGRDCWCEPGCDNTCGKRFDWQLGDLPYGYDHKYTYSHIGYNLKATDMQAAVGVAQMEKLDGFIEARRRNFEALRAGLRELEEFFILPEATRWQRAELVRFPARGARERALHAQSGDTVSGGTQDCDAPACSAATWSASRRTTNAPFVWPVR